MPSTEPDRGLFGGRGVLVSLPGAALETIELPGSLADPHEVMAADIAPELRAALHLLRDHALRHRVELRCLARPELFTHGLALDWLQTRIGDFDRHLCLSDGSTVKLLPGLQNHVFFHDRSRAGGLAALRALSRRAPQMMAGLQGQVNAQLGFGGAGHAICPPAQFLSCTTPPEHPRARLLPFFFNRHSADEPARYIEQQAPISLDTLSGVTAVRYVPLTAMALADPAFALLVAGLITAAMFAADALLVLRLPPLPRPANLAAQIAAIVPPLRDSALLIPRAATDHVLYITDDIEENHPLATRAELHLLMHDTFEFWRHSAAFYGRATTVTVFSPAEPEDRPAFLPLDITPIYGARALRRWISAPVGA